MPCLVCGCPTGGRARCPAHPRGTTTQRGYDASFEKAKRTTAYRLATHCATCGDPFSPDNPKTAGHVVAVRRGGDARDGVIPQCQDCNYGWRRTGA
jgi:hypothetical protein